VLAEVCAAVRGGSRSRSGGLHGEYCRPTLGSPTCSRTPTSASEGRQHSPPPEFSNVGAAANKWKASSRTEQFRGENRGERIAERTAVKGSQIEPRQAGPRRRDPRTYADARTRGAKRTRSPFPARARRPEQGNHATSSLQGREEGVPRAKLEGEAGGRPPYTARNVQSTGPGGGGASSEARGGGRRPASR